MIAYVNADFVHHGNGQGMDVPGGVGPGAVNLQQIARPAAKDSLGKMTAAGVPCAEDENGRFLHGHLAENRKSDWPQKGAKSAK